MARLTVTIDVPTKNQQWAYVKGKMMRKLRRVLWALESSHAPFSGGGSNHAYRVECQAPTVLHRVAVAGLLFSHTRARGVAGQEVAARRPAGVGWRACTLHRPTTLSATGSQYRNRYGTCCSTTGGMPS